MIVSGAGLRGPIAAGVALAALVAMPSQALGADATKLVANGPAAKQLRAAGVRIVPVKPARGGNRQVVLPVAAGLAGKTTLLRQRGSILLERGQRKVRLSRLTVRLRGKHGVVEGRLGRREIDLFQILKGGRRKIDASAGSVRLARLKIKLTKRASRKIRRRLGLERRGPLRFGRLFSNLAGTARNGGGSGGGTGQPTAAGAGPAAQTGCPLPRSAGGVPESSPPLKAVPAGSDSIVAAALNWHVRESFIRYIATGQGTTPIGGATAAPAVTLPGTSEALSYDYGFPFANGWHHAGADPADPADDSAAVYFTGGLAFSYRQHGIDLTASNPEIELDGAASRAIFAVSDNGGTPERQVLIGLDLANAAGVSVSGSTYTYDRVPGAIPAGAASSTFAGFYTPGTEFGCVTVSFTTSG
jgi:hypothetical protein